MCCHHTFPSHARTPRCFERQLTFSARRPRTIGELLVERSQRLQQILQMSAVAGHKGSGEAASVVGTCVRAPRSRCWAFLALWCLMLATEGWIYQPSTLPRPRPLICGRVVSFGASGSAREAVLRETAKSRQSGSPRAGPSPRVARGPRSAVAFTADGTFTICREQSLRIHELSLSLKRLTHDPDARRQRRR